MSEKKLRILFEGAPGTQRSAERPQVLDIPLDGNLNLLAHAQCEEAFLGSQCGGHGKCGADRILILSGGEALSPPTEAERRLISAEDLKRGVRLACQTFPDHTKNDITVNALGRGAHPRPSDLS
jgi:ferredoxin